MIERSEVEALLFNVADVVAYLDKIASLLEEGGNEGEADEG